MPLSFAKYLLLTIAILWSADVTAQRWPSELWHDGKVVLDNGDTLRGMIKYDLDQNVVQYTAASKQAEAYSARNVLFFEIFDETVRKYRQFYVLPYNHVPNYKTQVFFELLDEGKVTLLSREKLEYKTVGNYAYGGYYGGPYQRVVLTYQYFLMQEDGTLEPFRGTKNDFLYLMDDRKKEIQKFVRANKLNYDNKYDVARIVKYYNSLTQR
jgi:hypothetical protein